MQVMIWCQCLHRSCSDTVNSSNYHKVWLSVGAALKTLIAVTTRVHIHFNYGLLSNRECGKGREKRKKKGTCSERRIQPVASTSGVGSR